MKMKKILAVLTGMSLFFSLTACKQAEEEQVTPATVEQVATEVAQEQDSYEAPDQPDGTLPEDHKSGFFYHDVSQYPIEEDRITIFNDEGFPLVEVWHEENEVLMIRVLLTPDPSRGIDVEEARWLNSGEIKFDDEGKKELGKYIYPRQIEAIGCIVSEYPGHDTDVYIREIPTSSDNPTPNPTMTIFLNVPTTKYHKVVDRTCKKESLEPGHSAENVFYSDNPKSS